MRFEKELEEEIVPGTAKLIPFVRCAVCDDGIVYVDYKGTRDLNAYLKSLDWERIDGLWHCPKCAALNEARRYLSNLSR